MFNKKNWFFILDNWDNASGINCCGLWSNQKNSHKYKIWNPNDESIRTWFNIQGTITWFCDKREKKYPNSTRFTIKLLLSFALSLNELIIYWNDHLDQCSPQAGDLNNWGIRKWYFCVRNDLLLKKKLFEYHTLWGDLNWLN